MRYLSIAFVVLLAACETAPVAVDGGGDAAVAADAAYPTLVCVGCGVICGAGGVATCDSADPSRFPCDGCVPFCGSGPPPLPGECTAGGYVLSSEPTFVCPSPLCLRY